MTKQAKKYGLYIPKGLAITLLIVGILLLFTSNWVVILVGLFLIVISIVALVSKKNSAIHRPAKKSEATHVTHVTAKSKPSKKQWYSSPWKIILAVFAVIIIVPIVVASVNQATDPTQTPEAKQAKAEADEQQRKQEAARVYQETVDTYAPIYCANHQDITVNESTLHAQGWPMADNQKGITEDECKVLIGLLYVQRDGYANQISWIKSVAERKVAIGMTKIEVVYAWGSPNDINKTTSSGGTWEQWVFGNPIYGADYVYFDNDLVTSIQT